MNMLRNTLKPLKGAECTRFGSRTHDVIRHLRAWGPTGILSDGDVVLQPRKVQRSGLWDAIEGRVLIYIYKEQMLDAVVRHHPAGRYVMLDNKLRILAAMKAVLHDRLTTVFPRLGHYALNPGNVAAYPPTDLTIKGIGDLGNYDLSTLPGVLETGCTE